MFGLCLCVTGYLDLVLIAVKIESEDVGKVWMKNEESVK